MKKDNQLNLLCVDDEAGILRSLTRLLRGEEFNIITAGSGAEALDILEQQSVQVLVADQRMPDMNGIDLLERVKNRHPQIVRVVLSGFADIASILEAINKGEVFRYLGKPWNDEELKTMLRQCFAQYRLEQENKELVSVVNHQNEQLAVLNSRLEKQVATQQQDLDDSADDLKQVENGLRILHGIVQNIPLPLFGVDAQGQIVIANAQAIALAGEKVAIGNLLADVVGSDIESKIKHQIMSSLSSSTALVQGAGQQSTQEYMDVGFGRISAFPLAIDTQIHGGIVVITESAA